ncbi:uncharacterized protein EI90DRAFT_2941237, partial [Cantharellus anzutake]|uniref:uncharacterized protein n=1 Tax=Cantharellus anzutake TaxID=1750568 RepID=UPI001905877B
SQGQTIWHVIIDLAPPPTGGLTPFNTYVALSRSSGRDTIRLLRAFNEGLFRQPASPILEVEDERLGKETCTGWERTQMAEWQSGRVDNDRNHIITTL